MADAYLQDAAKLTDALIDVTKRWCGNTDTVDGRTIALAYTGALGAFLAQITDEADKLILVQRAAQTLIDASGVPLEVVGRVTQ